MKRLFLVIAFALLLVIPLHAADVSFIWDPMPAGQTWTKVRIYDVTGAVPTMKAEVAATVTTATVANAQPGQKYIARSFNGAFESADSNIVTLPPVPMSPTNLKFTITITVAGQ